ncbi:hypothetical protein ES703_80919 [subsurface metagenome]
MLVSTSTGGNYNQEVMCNDKFGGGKKYCGWEVMPMREGI